MLVKVKPTSAGRRSLVKVVTPGLHKGKPESSLVEKQNRKSGRNNNGHVTTRHKGGGHKQHYRIVDFKRDKDGVAAKVERVEYDPNRSAHIALLCYADGERRYIIAPRGVEVGATLMNGAEAPIKPGNCLPLRNIPVGSTIHCVEMMPKKGAAPPVPACNCWPAKAAMPSCACVPARSARCTSTAAPPWVKWATRSTACAPSARPAPTVGVASAPPCAARR
jgi:large subunit ribosomal protein L2